MDDRTFVDILRDRAQVSGDKIAYRFLVDGDKQELTLTYGQLHQRALAIAARLKDEAKPGDRALLLYPPGLEFICAFFGCLYAGVIAVPAYPPGKSRLVQNVKRLELLSRNCTPAVVLCDDGIRDILNNRITDETQQSVLAQIEHNTSQDNSSLALLKAKVISTSSINDSVSESVIITPSVQDLAFLQYTSGSTGNPKGVMVSHKSLYINSYHICRTFKHSENTIGCNWLPQYHDMGLSGPILQSVFKGFCSILFAPSEFVKSPLQWLKYISQFRATSAGGPNFAYELCCRQFDESSLDGLDLSCWKIAQNGAERVRRSTLREFEIKFSSYGFNSKAFLPLYGMAEHVVMISAGDISSKYKTTVLTNSNTLVEEENIGSNPKNNVFVGCGQSLPHHEIVIVDRNTKKIMSDGCVNEIWCKGQSVGQGYWCNELATKETFQAYTADGQGPFLRTGDLGFMKDGELYIVGRVKDMIVIRGRNYDPQDVEYTVEVAHDGIRQGCVAVFGFEEEGKEKLCVVCEVERAFVKKDHDKITQAIIENVIRENELGVSAVLLLKPGRIFKTTSGKIQRRKTKQAFLSCLLPEVFRWEAVTVHSEKELIFSAVHGSGTLRDQLKAWAAQQLGKDTSQITEDINFSSLGFDSMQAISATTSLSNVLDRELKVSYFYDYPSVNQLADFLESDLYTHTKEEMTQTDIESTDTSGKTSNLDLVLQNDIKLQNSKKASTCSMHHTDSASGLLSRLNQLGEKGYDLLCKEIFHSKTSINEECRLYAKYRLLVENFMGNNFHAIESEHYFQDMLDVSQSMVRSNELWSRSLTHRSLAYDSFIETITNPHFLQSTIQHSKDELSKVLRYPTAILNCNHDKADFMCMTALIYFLRLCKKNVIIIHRNMHDQLFDRFVDEGIIFLDTNKGDVVSRVEKYSYLRPYIFLLQDVFSAFENSTSSKISFSELIKNKNIHSENKVIDTLIHKNFHMKGDIFHLAQYLSIPIIPFSGAYVEQKFSCFVHDALCVSTKLLDETVSRCYNYLYAEKIEYFVKNLHMQLRLEDILAFNTWL